MEIYGGTPGHRWPPTETAGAFTRARRPARAISTGFPAATRGYTLSPQVAPLGLAAPCGADAPNLTSKRGRNLRCRCDNPGCGLRGLEAEAPLPPQMVPGICSAKLREGGTPAPQLNV